MTRMKINKVAIVGGTHGNEFTGTYLVKTWAKNKDEITRESFITETLWANPKAFYENKRYIDADLNRSFLLDDLKNSAIHTYEGNRAKIINSILGPKENPVFDFIIDIHTTTSNMGITLVVLEGDKFNLRLASFIKSNLPNVNLYYFKDQSGDLPYLTTITSKRIGIEIGPIPQGLIRHDIFEQAKEAIRLILDYIHRTNIGLEPEYKKEIEVFIHRTTLNFPVDEFGNICALVHRNLQDKDFTELKKGDPIFITLNGETITYNEDTTTYPVFINEAAYYENKIALILTDRAIIRI